MKRPRITEQMVKDAGSLEEVHRGLAKSGNAFSQAVIDRVDLIDLQAGSDGEVTIPEEKEGFGSVGKEARSAIEKRKEALEEIR